MADTFCDRTHAVILDALPVRLDHFLIVGAALLCMGIYCMLTRRNAVALLMGVELILNAANICLVAIARFLPGGPIDGTVMAIFVILLAASEAAVAFGIVIALYQGTGHVEVDAIDRLRG